MACYVAWYGKKRTRLADLEQAFVAALNSNLAINDLEAAAEVIRIAQIRALNEKAAKFAPSEKNAAILSRIEQDVQGWKDMPVKAITDGYRNPEERQRMSSAVRRADK